MFKAMGFLETFFSSSVIFPTTPKTLNSEEPNYVFRAPRLIELLQRRWRINKLFLFPEQVSKKQRNRK